MKAHVFWVVAAALLATIASQSVNDDRPQPEVFGFNCKRNGARCFGVSKCEESGRCTCEEGRQGPACEMEREYSTECGDSCIGGYCFKEKPKESCTCEEKYVLREGKCQPRVYVNCTTEAITFAIYPTVGDGKFNGTLIVMGKEIDTTCDPYPNVKILADAARKGRSATIRFDECGNATRFVMENGDTQVSFNVVVSYFPGFQLPSDEMYEASCVLPVSEAEMQLSPMHATISRTNPNELPVSREVHVVQLEVEWQPEFRIGDWINFTYILADQDVYKDFRLINLVAFSSGNIEYLIKDGCLARVPSVVPIDNYKVGRKIHLHFQAFRLQGGGNQVNFNSTVQVCMDACSEPECPDSENGQGNNVGANRRRRDVTDEDELFEEMMTTVFINSPFDRHSSSKQAQVRRLNKRSDACAPSVVLLILSIVLAVFLVLMTASCLFFCVRSRAGTDIINYGSRSASHENPGYGRDFK